MTLDNTFLHHSPVNIHTCIHNNSKEDTPLLYAVILVFSILQNAGFNSINEFHYLSVDFVARSSKPPWDQTRIRNSGCLLPCSVLCQATSFVPDLPWLLLWRLICHPAVVVSTGCMCDSGLERWWSGVCCCFVGLQPWSLYLGKFPVFSGNSLLLTGDIGYMLKL